MRAILFAVAYLNLIVFLRRERNTERREKKNAGMNAISSCYICRDYLTALTNVAESDDSSDREPNTFGT